MINHSSKKAIFLWCIANIFFALQFITRLAIGLMREDITTRFAIDSSMFGTLSGYYYLGYGVSQIPLGLMLDRLNYRFITSFAIFITAIGSYLFVITQNWELLLFSRFLTGLGSGVAFLAVVKITKLFFKQKYHSILIGLSFSFGLIGAVCATTPLLILFQWYGNQNVLSVISLLITFIGFVTLLFGNITQQNNQQNKSDILASLSSVLLNYRIMLIALCGGLMVGSLEGFADVWAMSMFSQIFGFSHIDSSMIVMYVYFGMCCGGPILVSLATIINSNDIMIFLTGILTISIFLMLFLFSSFSSIALIVMMFTLGILCCYQVLVFAAVSDEVDKHSSGFAISVTNCINMSFGYIFHYLIGTLFSHNWQGEKSEVGSFIYSKQAYIYSLSIVPIGCLLGMIGFLILYLLKTTKKS